MIKTKDEFFIFVSKEYLSNQKIDLLNLLASKEWHLQELSKKLKASCPLVSYYLNGNDRTPGLVGLGLAKRTHDEKGMLQGFVITELGKDILKTVK